MNTELQTATVASPPSVTTQGMIFDPSTIRAMQAMAEAMAGARVTIPKHLIGAPGDCLAIVMQAAQWQMNPFAVAQKTHIVNGSLGYEAQLVNAVVSSSPLLSSRIQYAWEGDWKGCNGKVDKSDERAVIVSATLAGESVPRTLRMSMAQVGDVRNSPLWVSDPRQQLAYLATKRWARLHAPDVMLGVYTVDELQEVRERDMGPAQVVETRSPPLAESRTADVTARLRKRAAAPVAEQPEQGPDLESVLRLIAEAVTPDGLSDAAQMAAKLTDPHEKTTAREAYGDRKEAITERIAIQTEAESPVQEGREV